MPENDNKSATKTAVKVTINEKWCKKCGICVAFCPKIIFVADEFKMPVVRNSEQCIKCMLCVVRCPEFAVEVKDEDAPPKQKEVHPGK